MKRWINAALVRRSVIVGALVCSGAVGFSCSPAGKDSTVSGDGTGASSVGSGGTVNGSGGTKTGPDLGPDVRSMQPEGPCQGLECAVPACTPGVTTSITGKVFAPNGTLPLYNVLVYVPNTPIAPVMPFTDGAKCDRCDASVLNPVTSAVTDETGSFKLEKVPAGQNIPLVIQVGKWRRQLTIPVVMPCMDTPLTDPQMTRLPKNKLEGDLPKIAIAVGGADQMECFPLRLGIDASEFTTNAGDGRIHMFVGHSGDGGDQPVRAFDATHGGQMLPSADGLWATKAELMKYDITILSCEGESYGILKPMSARQALYDYASEGGRVFASHWHNVWFAEGPPPVPTTGTWVNRANPSGGSVALTATINQTFPKGAALAQWLVNVGASMTVGQMPVTFPRDNIQAVNPMLAREWITVDNPREGNTKAIQYMSFNTPIGAAEAQICGRAVYTDLHVAAVDNNDTANAKGFPASCQMRPLSEQEKAVAFMLFDLSACVQNDDIEPQPPE